MEIQLVDVKGETLFSSVDDFIAAALDLGFTQSVAETDGHSSPDLQELPKFKELAGPLGGEKTSQGKPRVRYETWEAFDLYSR